MDWQTEAAYRLVIDPHRSLDGPMKKSQLVLLAVTTVAGLLPALPAAAAVPAQEPGVTLRTFDLQTARDTICTLKPGQTPNVDKLMPAINWTTAADFGLEDQFQSEVIGNINITTAGTYGFRLTSDDGSRLLIDSATVINHDGAHGATAKEGAANLTTGYHALHIDYFERDGGQQLTLEWRPPGASAFALVPDECVEHGRRRGAGDRAGPQGVRERRGQPGRRPAADRCAPRLHADQPAPVGLPAAGERDGLVPRRPAGDRHLGRR